MLAVRIRGPKNCSLTPNITPSSSQFIEKDPDAGEDWRREKGTTEDGMVGWHHRLDGPEFEQAPGVGDGQGDQVCCSPWGRKESDTTWWLNSKNNNPLMLKKKKKKKLPQPLGHLRSCPLSLPLDRSRLRLSRLHLTGVALMPPVACLHPSPPFPAPWRGDVLRAQLWSYPWPCLLFGRSVVSDSVTPWTAARQASLSLTGPVRGKAFGIPEPWLEQSLWSGSPHPPCSSGPVYPPIDLFNVYFNRWIIALQYWFDFCHTLTWISHKCTYVMASLITQLVKNLPARQETPIQFLGQEDPLEKG